MAPGSRMAPATTWSGPMARATLDGRLGALVPTAGGGPSGTARPGRTHTEREGPPAVGTDRQHLAIGCLRDIPQLRAARELRCVRHLPATVHPPRDDAPPVTGLGVPASARDDGSLLVVELDGAQQGDGRAIHGKVDRSPATAAPALHEGHVAPARDAIADGPHPAIRPDGDRCQDAFRRSPKAGRRTCQRPLSRRAAYGRGAPAAHPAHRPDRAPRARGDIHERSVRASRERRVTSLQPDPCSGWPVAAGRPERRGTRRPRRRGRCTRHAGQDARPAADLAEPHRDPAALRETHEHGPIAARAVPISGCP